MARYTDLDNLIDAVEGTTWYHINKNGELVKGANGKDDVPLYKHEDIARVLSEAPESDVVPKSEVERLTNLIKELQGYNEAWVEDNGKLRNANKNIAREIFSEIDKNVYEYLNVNYAERYFYLLETIAELKKKYTEGE